MPWHHACICFKTKVSYLVVSAVLPTIMHGKTASLKSSPYLDILLFLVRYISHSKVKVKCNSSLVRVGIGFCFLLLIKS